MEFNENIIDGIGAANPNKVTTTYFYLFRHGQTDGNVARILCGQSGMPMLTECGHADAAAVADKLRARDPGRTYLPYIISSPLTRALQTAEIVAATQPRSRIEIHDRLMEANFGIYEGRHIADVPKQQMDDFWDTWDAKFDGGESRREVLARVMDLLSDVHKYIWLNEPENHIYKTTDRFNVGVATHGCVLNCLMDNFDAHVNGHIPQGDYCIISATGALPHVQFNLVRGFTK